MKRCVSILLILFLLVIGCGSTKNTLSSWELIPESGKGIYHDGKADTYTITDRIRIPGGWLVRCRIYTAHGTATVSITFIKKVRRKEWRTN